MMVTTTTTRLCLFGSAGLGGGGGVAVLLLLRQEETGGLAQPQKGCPKVTLFDGSRTQHTTNDHRRFVVFSPRGFSTGRP